jgi:fucose permease
MDVLDTIGWIFFYGIAATPIISFFVVRKRKISIDRKIAYGIIVTVVFAAIFWYLGISILGRNGLGVD